MVIGEGEKMPAALIQPNFEFIKDWIERKNKNIGKLTSNTSSEVVKESIQKEIDECNKVLENGNKLKDLN